jgi:hypothetical protein
MNVGELKKVLGGVADDVSVVMDSDDHSYRETSALVSTALLQKRTKLDRWEIWTEDYGENETPEATFGKRVPVVVIS